VDPDIDVVILGVDVVILDPAIAEVVAPDVVTLDPARYQIYTKSCMNNM